MAEAVQVNDELVKDIVTKFTKPIAETFNAVKQSVSESGEKFSDGLKELSGGMIDLQGFSDDVSKKFQAFGNLFAPLRALFNSLAISTGILAVNKKKEVKETKKATKESEGLSSSFKKLKLGVGFLSLKFLLIVAAVGAVLVVLYKLAKSFGFVKILQATFDTLTNVIGRVMNMFDSFILALDSALGPFGFLEDAQRKEIENKIVTRTTERALREQRSKDADRIAEINAMEISDAEKEQKIREEGLITNNMYLDSQGKLVEEIDGQAVAVEGLGQERFINKVDDEIGDDLRSQALSKQGITVDEQEEREENRRMSAQANFTALTAQFKMADQESQVATAQSKLDKIKSQGKGKFESEERFQQRLKLAEENLAEEQIGLQQLQMIAAQYQDEEGLSAKERINLMATEGKDGEAYNRFDFDDLEREFEELNPNQEINRQQANMTLSGVGNSDLQLQTGERLQQKIDEGKELTNVEKDFMNNIMPIVNNTVSNSASYSGSGEPSSVDTTATKVKAT